jgi:hypothetical protein
VTRRLNRDRLRFIGRWLSVALLVAQFGAEIHLYSHALADPVDRMGTAKTCATCLASSQLQNAVAPPTAAAPVYAIAFATVVAESAQPSAHVAPFRAFRSRAPPALA